MVKQLLKKLIPEKNRLQIRFFLMGVRSIFLYGRQRKCNVCHGSFSNFLPYGILIKRKDAACPRCLSLERTRLVWFYLQNEIKIKEKKLKVLDFAPHFRLEKELKKLPNLDYLSVDINPNLAMQKEDIKSLSFASDSFDLILNSHVLSIIDDDKQAIKELYRVCKPGGMAIIQTEINPEIKATFEPEDAKSYEGRLKHFQREDLFRNYGTDFKDRLAESGFTVNVVEYGKQLGPELIRTYGLGINEFLHICSKPSKF